jgi:hypothetical protein
LKKWHLSIIALSLFAVVEWWPAFNKWNMERDFLSDDLEEAGQCIVALEYVSPEMGGEDLSWNSEARELYKLALEDAARKSEDELTNVSGNMSIARYNLSVGARVNHYSNLAINKARESVGFGTGEINGRLVKKWAASELCQKARNTYLEKIRKIAESPAQTSTEVVYGASNNQANSQTISDEIDHNHTNTSVAVSQQAKKTVVVSKVDDYSESGDGYAFSTQNGETYYVYNAGGTQPRPGEELIKPAIKICIVLNPENGMGDVSSVTAGTCPMPLS